MDRTGWGPHTSDVRRPNGWLMALLVARNVEPHASAGIGPRQRGASEIRRVRAREFARRAGTSHKRILVFLGACSRAAEDGPVPFSDLAPGAQVALPGESDVPFFGADGYCRTYDGLRTERAKRSDRQTGGSWPSTSSRTPRKA